MFLFVYRVIDPVRTAFVFLVLEFELRKANETIKNLRGSLTKASSAAAGEVVSAPASAEVSLLIQ